MNKSIYFHPSHLLNIGLQCTMISTGCAIGYGSPSTILDKSNMIRKGTNGDATMLRPTLMAAVPAILDRLRDGVREKVGVPFFPESKVVIFL